MWRDLTGEDIFAYGIKAFRIVAVTLELFVPNTDMQRPDHALVELG